MRRGRQPRGISADERKEFGEWECRATRFSTTMAHICGNHAYTREREFLRSWPIGQSSFRVEKDARREDAPFLTLRNFEEFRHLSFQQLGHLG